MAGGSLRAPRTEPHTNGWGVTPALSLQDSVHGGQVPVRRLQPPEPARASGRRLGRQEGVCQEPVAGAQLPPEGEPRRVHQPDGDPVHPQGAMPGPRRGALEAAPCHAPFPDPARGPRATARSVLLLRLVYVTIVRSQPINWVGVARGCGTQVRGALLLTGWPGPGPIPVAIGRDLLPSELLLPATPGPRAEGQRGDRNGAACWRAEPQRGTPASCRSSQERPPVWALPHGSVRTWEHMCPPGCSFELSVCLP